MARYPYTLSDSWLSIYFRIWWCESVVTKQPNIIKCVVSNFACFPLAHQFQKAECLHCADYIECSLAKSSLSSNNIMLPSIEDLDNVYIASSGLPLNFELKLWKFVLQAFAPTKSCLPDQELQRMLFSITEWRMQKVLYTNIYVY